MKVANMADEFIYALKPAGIATAFPLALQGSRALETRDIHAQVSHALWPRESLEQTSQCDCYLEIESADCVPGG